MKLQRAHLRSLQQGIVLSLKPTSSSPFSTPTAVPTSYLLSLRSDGLTPGKDLTVPAHCFNILALTDMISCPKCMISCSLLARDLRA